MKEGQMKPGTVLQFRPAPVGKVKLVKVLVKLAEGVYKRTS